MLLHLLRISTTDESTISALYVDGTFACHCVEDAWKAEKEKGTTRIPQGLYEIKLREEGGMTRKYAERFPDIHRGMLHLQDVPEFSWVYIHTGNTAKHTDGCLIIGDSAGNNQIVDGFVGGSVNAYRRLYPRIAEAILKEDDVKIRISDFG